MKCKIREIMIFMLFLMLFLVSCGKEHKNKTAVLETTAGTIKIELFEDQTPITAKNFIDLTENGFYDGVKFHRVINGFMIQAGDPLSKDDSKKNLWGTGGPGYTIEDEFVEGLSNVRGTIAMANTGQPNSGGSQFFINLVDNTFLDGKHSVFGKVVEGMDVVDKISKASIDGNDKPLENIVIKKVRIV